MGFKIFGKYIITNTIYFNVQNHSFEGINKLTTLFDLINKKYNVEVKIDVSPKYYLNISSENEESNLEILENIKKW